MNFYDTCALLNLQEKAFTEEGFIISYITLIELENIKSSRSKSDDLKYKARHLASLLKDNEDKYDVVFGSSSIDKAMSLAENTWTGNIASDVEIIKCAKHIIDTYGFSKDEITFVTDDILCGLIAKNMFDLNVKSSNSLLSDSDEYTGYKEIVMSCDDLEDFYGNDNYKTENKFDLLENQYLIIRQESDDGDPSEPAVVATYRWTDGELKKVSYKNIKSSMFGDKIKPKDIYQTCAIDSILNNKMTAISGRAGSGKSLISLMVAMHLIESGEYDRIVIMFNPTKARGASDMGFYTGNATEKAMQNSIGEILTTKFGDRYAVDYLLQQNKIRLVSMADVRGMEIKDNEILYITECQNTSADLLKLCITRASNECKIIIEGDFNSQVDSYMYEGTSNGMRRAIEVLKGDQSFGYVSLPNVWRSKIAELADKF